MTVNPTRIAGIVATGAAAAIALTACSSSGSSGSGSTSTPPPPTTSTSAQQQQAAGSGTSSKSATATETEFHIALSSKKFSPGTWTFHVKNAGSITHALTVDGPGVSNKSTSDISPGKSATLTVTLKSGSYEIFCPVGDHKMEGMDETVQVS